MENTGKFRFLLVMTAYFPFFVLLAIQRHQGWGYINSTGGWYEELFGTIWYNFPKTTAPKDLLTLLIIIALLISSISIVLVLKDLNYAREKEFGEDKVQIIKINPREQDFLSYLLTYIPAMVSMTVTDSKDLIAFLYLMALILWLSVRTDLLFINPILMIFGYNLYSIETKENSIMQSLLITKATREDLISHPTRSCCRYAGNFILVDLKGVKKKNA